MDSEKYSKRIREYRGSYILRRTVNGKRYAYYSTDKKILTEYDKALDSGIIPEKKKFCGVNFSENELNEKFGNDKEEWKWIKGFEGLYAASNIGRIISFHKNVNGKFISAKNKNGWYLTFPIIDSNGKRYTKRVHQVVAELFIGTRPNGFHIHHKDGNKQNNCVENLEYVSPKEHHKLTLKEHPDMLNPMIQYNRNRYTGEYGSRDRRKTIHKTRKNQGLMIEQYSLDGEFIAEFYTAKEASAATGVCSRNISQVAGKDEYKPGKFRKQAGGYIWKYGQEVI